MDHECRSIRRKILQFESQCNHVFGGSHIGTPTTNKKTHLAQRPQSELSAGSRSGSPAFVAIKDAVSDLYRIEDFDLVKIGSGFFSDVFKATHRVSRHIMVLKMNRQRSNRVNTLREIQLLNMLKHPNLLRLEAACVNNGQLHALTEYINGGSLDRLIASPQFDLDWSTRISIGLDIVNGLQYLHSQSFFHRDLTSKNILIRHNDQPAGITALIADLGLATRIPRRPDLNQHRHSPSSNSDDDADYMATVDKSPGQRLPWSQTGRLASPRRKTGQHNKCGRLSQAGSPFWMSPECLRGEHYDEKADIFAFGIVMCELIARSDADPDVLPRTANFGVDYIAFTSSVCPPQCPPELLRHSLLCVQIKPESRPDAGDLVVTFGQILQLRLLAEKSAALDTGHKRSLSDEEDGKSDIAISDEVPAKNLPNQQEKQLGALRSPSDRARLHCSPRLAKPSVINDGWPVESARVLTLRRSNIAIGRDLAIRDSEFRPTTMNPFVRWWPQRVEDDHVAPSAQSTGQNSNQLSCIDVFSSCLELPTATSTPRFTSDSPSLSKSGHRRESRGHCLPFNNCSSRDDCYIGNRVAPRKSFTARSYSQPSLTSVRCASALYWDLHEEEIQPMWYHRLGGSCESGFCSLGTVTSSSATSSALLSYVDSSAHRQLSRLVAGRRWRIGPDGAESVDLLFSSMSTSRSVDGSSTILTLSDDTDFADSLSSELTIPQVWMLRQRQRSTSRELDLDGSQVRAHARGDVRDFVRHFEKNVDSTCSGRQRKHDFISLRQRWSAMERQEELCTTQPSALRRLMRLYDSSSGQQHRIDGRRGESVGNLRLTVSGRHSIHQHQRVNSAKIDFLANRVNRRQRDSKTLGHQAASYISAVKLGGGSLMPFATVKQSQRLQLCDGSVQSKLSIFDRSSPHRRRRLRGQGQPADAEIGPPGLVQSKLALFDGGQRNSRTLEYIRRQN